MNRQQIEGIVNSDRVREFQAGSWFFGVDNNQVKASLWDDCDLKVLVVFLSPGKTRGVANSYTALDAIIRQAGPRVFVDYAYFPHKEDLKVYAKYGLPYWFGNLSHAPVEEYDVVLVSTSILVEFLNIFHAYKSCGIPLYHKDRIDNPEWPLIIAGGIPVADHDTLGGNSGLVDLVYAGYAETRLNKIIAKFAEWKKTLGSAFRSSKRMQIKSLVTSYDSVYYPDGYDVIYEEEPGRKHVIKEIKPKYAWVPAEVTFHSNHDLNEIPGFENKIFCPDNMKATAADFLISQGCSGGGGCSFCAEGTNCGGWREISMERAVWSLEETLKRTAANSLSPYSFNLNYYSRFIDLFYEVAKRFSSTSLRNMRIDVISVAPEYFKAANVFGLATISMPIEGFGDRVRNKVLNKNVSLPQIHSAFKSAFTSRAMRLKMGMVLTCHETKEDLDDAAAEFESVIKLKQEANVNIAFQCNICLLVHYPHTGCGWMKRNSSLVSAGKVRAMKDFIGRFREHVRFKFSSSDYGTAVEQLSLDMGRSATQVWEKLALQEGQMYYGGWNARVLPFLKAEMAKKEIVLEDFFQERPKDWIFPVEMIPKKKKKYMNMLYDAAGKKQIRYCTKTYANLDPKCYDCGYCTTQEMKDSIMKRELGSCRTVDDIKSAMFENKPMSAVRVAFTVKREWAMYGKESLAFYIASRIIQQESLFKVYHSTKNVSNYMQMKANAEDWEYGNFFFDMQLKERDPSVDWEKIIGVVNADLESGHVTSIVKVEHNKRLPIDSRVVCVAELKGIGVQTVRDTRQKWKGTVRVAKTGGLGLLYGPTTEEAPFEYPELYVAPMDGGSKVAFVIPLNINPHLLLSSLFDVKYWKAMEFSSVRIVGYFHSDSGVCKYCGGQKKVSLTTRKEAVACSSCLAKASLKQ